MADETLTFDVTFRDFQFLQSYMTRRVFAKNKSGHAIALIGVVVCAVLLALVMVLVAESYRFYRTTALGLSYPASFYLVIILCLIAAIFSLIPAIKLRLALYACRCRTRDPCSARRG